MKQILQSILQAMDTGRDTVLVSIVETFGSSPGKIGAHMLTAGSGILHGTVGGGPLEARALELCRDVLETHSGRIERVILREDEPLGVGALCGGEVLLRLQYISCQDTQIKAAVQLALALLPEHRQCWLIENYNDTICGALSIYGEKRLSGGTVPYNVLLNLAEHPALIQTENSGDTRWFIQPLLQKEQVYIFGGGHVAQALAPVLANINFRCTIVEDRPEFCLPDLFTGVEKTRLLPLNNWENELHITSSDYLCIMTRGHEKDIECLTQALHTPAHYIGLMGSRRKIAFTREVLKKQGFSEQDIARIVTPIGLNIGAQTPAEIAISIAAQLITIRSSLAGSQK